MSQDRDWIKEVVKDLANHTQPSPLTMEKFAHLHEEIESIKECLTVGFKKMHDRQDITNGKVMENTRWRWLIMGGMVVTNIILIPLAFMVIGEVLKRI